jgi:hypothetical protein
MNTLMRGCASVALLLCLLLPAATVEARESDYRDRLEQANSELVRLEAHEFSAEAGQEFGQARLEVAEAQAQITAEDFARAEILLMRLEARLRLADSILERATIEALADERETEQFDMMSEADNVQIELHSAQQQRQQLQDNVGAIIAQMEAE